MDGEERQRLIALPETLTIYRGVSGGFQTGLSWTLDAEVGRWIATRFEQPDPVLIDRRVPEGRHTGSVPRARWTRKL